jgi:hypothetical protein
MINTTSTNMKPADELLSVRQKIKQLQDREAEIKNGMRAGDMVMDGDFAIARLVKRKSTRFDKKAAEAELGDLSRFNVSSESTVLIVDELVLEPGE